MSKSKKYPSNAIPVGKTVKIPVYSSLRFKDGQLVGEIQGYMDAPVGWIKQEKKVH